MSQQTLQAVGSGDVDASTIASHLIETVEDHTVGYGDRYPETESKGLVVQDNNRRCGIRHRVGEYAVGYDLTKFHLPDESAAEGRERFLDILSEVGLDPIGDYVRVYRDMGRGVASSYPETYLHVWVDGRVLIATTVNPITGNKDGEDRELGSGGYIGVGGEKGIAQRAESMIDDVQTKGDNLEHIEGKQEGELFY